MRIPDNETDFLNALVDAAELGATKALAKTDRLRPTMSRKEIERTYGPAVVRRWIKEGLIKGVQDGPGTTYRYDRIAVEAVAMISNRASFAASKEGRE